MVEVVMCYETCMANSGHVLMAALVRSSPVVLVLDRAA